MPLSRKKSIIYGIIIGLAQLCYIIVGGMITDSEKVNDPMAHAIYFQIVLPFSCLFFLVSAISGWLYTKAGYQKAINLSILIAIIISIIVSLYLDFTLVISAGEIVSTIFVAFIILLPIILLVALSFRIAIRKKNKCG
jgi:hypothetical protein